MAAKRMSIETRDSIERMYEKGYSIRKIANEIGRDKMTVQHYIAKKRDQIELEEYKKIKEDLLMNGLIGKDGTNVVEEAVKLRFEAEASKPKTPPRYYDQKAPPGPGKNPVGRPPQPSLKPEKSQEPPQQDGMGEVQPTTPPAFPPDEEQAQRLRKMHWYFPPGAGGSLLPKAFQNYNGVFKAGGAQGKAGFYLPADTAIQASRENARRMLYNLTIREGLQSRWLSVAESEWHIEPDDSNDPEQVKMATEIQKTIENIPDLLKMFVSLLKSRWYGYYGVQLNYQQNARAKLFVKEWDELHGDSLVMDMGSKEWGVYTINTGAPGVHKVDLVPGYIGSVHLFEDEQVKRLDISQVIKKHLDTRERDAVIIMKYDPAATDYLNPRQAGFVMGQGLRDTLYATWYVYQETLGNLHDWLSRIGSGVVMFKYKINNAQSYQQAVELAESLDNQAAIMVPVDVMENGGKPVEGIEIVQASAIGLDNFLRVIQDFYEPKMRRMIVGQDSTSQSTNAGLGSKIAEVHENSFSRICQYDSKDLEQTLTHQLVRVIQRWNHPGTEDRPCKFVMDLAKPNVKEQIDAVKLLADMGVEFDGDELRKLVGFSKPKEGANVVGGKSEQEINPFQQGEMFAAAEDDAVISQEEHKDLKDAGLSMVEQSMNQKNVE